MVDESGTADPRPSTGDADGRTPGGHHPADREAVADWAARERELAARERQLDAQRRAAGGGAPRPGDPWPLGTHGPYGAEGRSDLSGADPYLPPEPPLGPGPEPTSPYPREHADTVTGPARGSAPLPGVYPPGEAAPSHPWPAAHGHGAEQASYHSEDLEPLPHPWPYSYPYPEETGTLPITGVCAPGWEHPATDDEEAQAWPPPDAAEHWHAQGWHAQGWRYPDAAQRPVARHGARRAYVEPALHAWPSPAEWPGEQHPAGGHLEAAPCPTAAPEPATGWFPLAPEPAAEPYLPARPAGNGHPRHSELVERATGRAWSWFSRIAENAAAHLPAPPDEQPRPAYPTTGPAEPAVPAVPHATAATGITVETAPPPPGEAAASLPRHEAVDSVRAARPVRPTVGYALHTGQADAHRLEAQSRLLEPGTAAFLDTIGVGAGWRCLDVGCGHGQVSLLLSGRVAPTGRVVGVDGNRASLRVARGNAAAARARVAFLAADAGWLPAARDRFDLAYSRLLLGHLTEPVTTLRAMATAVRPGGVVAVEDVCFRPLAGGDAHGELAEFTELLTMVIRSRGGDPQIGPRLPALFAAAGLTDIAVTVLDSPVPAKGSAELLVEALDASADAALDAGLTDPARLGHLRRALAALSLPEIAEAGGTARLYQVRGRRPPRPGGAA